MVTVHIPLKHHDTLAKHGYFDVKHMSVAARRKALRAAVKDYGATYVIRKLNVLVIYNKHKHPRTSKMFHDDMQYVQGLNPKRKNKI